MDAFNNVLETVSMFSPQAQYRVACAIIRMINDQRLIKTLGNQCARQKIRNITPGHGRHHLKNAGKKPADAAPKAVDADPQVVNADPPVGAVGGVDTSEVMDWDSIRKMMDGKTLMGKPSCSLRCKPVDDNESEPQGEWPAPAVPGLLPR